MTDHLVEVGGEALVSILITIALVRGATATPRRTGGVLVLEYSATLRVFLVASWLLGLGLFAAIALFTEAVRPEEQSAFARMVVLLFGPSGVMVGGIIGWKIECDRHGLRSYAPWRSVREIPWSEITQVRRHTLLSPLVVETRSGHKLRLTQELVGLDEFRAEVRRHCRFDVSMTRPRRDGKVQWLESPALMKGIQTGIGVFGFALLLGVLFTDKNPSAAGIATGILSLVGCVGLGFAELYGVRVAFDEHEIRSYSPWRRVSRCSWTDIIRVHDDEGENFIAIESRTGQKIRVLRHFVGFEAFCDELQMRVTGSPPPYERPHHPAPERTHGDLRDSVSSDSVSADGVPDDREPGSGKNWIVLLGSPDAPLAIVFGPAALSFFEKPGLAFAVAKKSAFVSSTLLVRGGLPGWTLVTTPSESSAVVDQYTLRAHEAAADLADENLVGTTQDLVLQRPPSDASEDPAAGDDSGGTARTEELPPLLHLPTEYWSNRFPAGIEDITPLRHARALCAVGRPRRAEAVLTNALPVDDTGAVHFALGEVIADGGDAPRALPLLERAFKLAPEQAQVAQTLSIVYLQLGRAHDALRTALHAAAIADTFETWANVSSVAFVVEDHPVAYDAAKKAIDRDSGDGHGYFLAAAAARQLGRKDEARALLAAARRASRCSMPHEHLQWTIEAAEGTDEPQRPEGRTPRLWS